jgi:hypothetical protein
MPLTCKAKAANNEKADAKRRSNHKYCIFSRGDGMYKEGLSSSCAYHNLWDPRAGIYDLKLTTWDPRYGSRDTGHRSQDIGLAPARLIPVNPPRSRCSPGPGLVAPAAPPLDVATMVLFMQLAAVRGILAVTSLRRLQWR